MKNQNPGLRMAFLTLLATCHMGVAGTSDGPVEPELVVVVASKSPRPLSEVVGQVSVIDALEIENHLLEGLDDLLRYEPGIATESSGTRFGISGVNIRGIGGNRVAIEVDGVPIRNRFAIGNYSDGGRSLVETDRIKRLEVLHGPASALYGSDALGGVMAFTTFDPADLLPVGDGRRYYSLRGGARSADDSMVGSATAAWGSGRTSLLVAATWRNGHERDNGGIAEISRDLQDWDSRDHFLRLVRNTSGGHRLRLSAEDYRRDTVSRVRSILGYERFRSTTALQGRDHDENLRISADFEFSGNFWDSGVARVFHAAAETRQLSLEERAAARTPVRVVREFRYDTDLSGLEFNLFRSFNRGGVEHRLGVGIEWLRTESEELRDGFQQTLANGVVTKTVLGEDLPVRDFPVSTTDEYGLFVQDEIHSGDWVLVPALRFDRYELHPKTDGIFLEDNPAVNPVSLTEDEISPRLGVMRRVGEGWSLYGQYVRGFRAPPFEDANIGLDIPLFNIRAIPNPDLASETSNGFEIGIRQHSADRRFSLALFTTEYDDFIETRARIGVDPVTGVLLFQSRNIEQARIRGADLRLEQGLGAWQPRLERWNLNLAAFWAVGKNRETGQPLNSVSPPQAIVGLAWRSADQRWDAHVKGTFTMRQDEIDHGGGQRLETPGYGTVDLTGGFRPSARLEMRAGIYNVTDKRYWRWSDVSGLDADDPMLQLLTMPGRNYSISVRVEW